MEEHLQFGLKKMELEIVVGVKRLLLFKMVRLLGGGNYLHIVCKCIMAQLSRQKFNIFIMN